MLRHLQSLILGILVGTIVGLYFGWIQFPADLRSSEISQLAQRYRDEYTVMIAAGYAVDGDLPGTMDRLSLLDVADIPTALRGATERIISTSARSLQDIRLLVRLANDLGQLTPAMEPFLDHSGGAA